MHFRIRGNNIQVVRSQPDPETGKAKSVPLGSINRPTLRISDKLSQNCSPEELEKIKTWVRRRHALESLRQRVAALTLPEQVDLAVTWFEGASQNEETRSIADDIIVSLVALRRALNRRELL